ncbi:MAG: hypothetical protein R3336_07040, partial [Phycisphaeraceae bacterium]|nr:hypothetical protein [Phycisphaeraceae bacterium]
MSESTSPSPLARCWQWLTGDAAVELPDPGLGAANHEPIDWRRAVPFAALHLGCLLVLVTGVSWTAVAVCLGLYIARMFFVTGFYHRYFAHRGFQTSRAFQFVMGALGCTAGQRGPLWWAAQHRHHHNHSDGEKDHHSPRQLGFWRAHLGWFLTRTGFTTDRTYVGDWARYPELRWLNRLDWVPLLLLGGSLYLFGAFLNQTWPGLNTSGLQLLAWGFFVSTILCYHA